jgi:hypothetical protein
MDDITPENLLRKLKMHPRNETSAVCLIAGLEITRLRDEVETLRGLLNIHYPMALDRFDRAKANKERAKR